MAGQASKDCVPDVLLSDTQIDASFSQLEASHKVWACSSVALYILTRTVMKPTVGWLGLHKLATSSPIQERLVRAVSDGMLCIITLTSCVVMQGKCFKTESSGPGHLSFIGFLVALIHVASHKFPWDVTAECPLTQAFERLLSLHLELYLFPEIGRKVGAIRRERERERERGGGEREKGKRQGGC
jgi:hypothetical protein